MKKWFGMGVVGILLLLFVVNLLSNEPPPKKQEMVEIDDQKRVMQATNFELPTLDGSPLDLHSQRGKVVILNFWASWCQPCMEEAPHLQGFYEKNTQDVEILAVNVTTKDTVKDARSFVENFQLTFPILLDEDGSVSTMYGAFTFPTTVILNREGVIIKQIAGPVDEAYLEKLVADAL